MVGPVTHSLNKINEIRRVLLSTEATDVTLKSRQARVAYAASWIAVLTGETEKYCFYA